MDCSDDGKRDTKKKKSRLRVLKVLEALYCSRQPREELLLYKLG
jgi:hypothetical protein